MPLDVHHVYKTKLSWKEGKIGVFKSDGKPDLDIATPPGFHGPEGFWSPEELFVASAEGCNMTTFLAIIHRRDIEIESYESESEGVLETTDDGIMFTKIIIRPKVKVKNPEDVEKVKTLLERAHKYCLITNSIKTEVVVEVE